ncbi:MAG TPA: Sec-independent protein translocase protein TatB [Salinisphaeraceae bacterium]|nr:Sec-independent protein translocase protein TatB [Salinisphaeraceae bacterium]
MFDIGFWELTLVAVIALIVLGPERLPGAARTLGKWVGRARRYANTLTSELEREVDVQGFKQEINRARDNVEASTREAVKDLDDVETGTRDVLDDINRAADNMDDEQTSPQVATNTDNSEASAVTEKSTK